VVNMFRAAGRQGCRGRQPSGRAWLGTVRHESQAVPDCSTHAARETKNSSALIGYLPTGFPNVPERRFSAGDGMVESGFATSSKFFFSPPRHRYSDPGEWTGPVIAGGGRGGIGRRRGNGCVDAVALRSEAISKQGAGTGAVGDGRYWNPVLSGGSTRSARDPGPRAGGGLGMTHGAWTDSGQRPRGVVGRVRCPTDLDRIFLGDKPSSPRRVLAKLTARASTADSSTPASENGGDRVLVEAVRWRRPENWFAAG